MIKRFTHPADKERNFQLAVIQLLFIFFIGLKILLVFICVKVFHFLFSLEIVEDLLMLSHQKSSVDLIPIAVEEKVQSRKAKNSVHGNDQGLDRICAIITKEFEELIQTLVKKGRQIFIPGVQIF